MGKRILSVLVVILLMGSLFAGCGARKSNSADMAKAEMPPAAAESVKADYGSGEEPKKEAKSTSAAPAQENQAVKDGIELDKVDPKATAFTNGGSGSQTVPNAILAQRKIIRNANISVEVENFDKAYGQIKSIISAFGFVQESNIKKEKIYQAGKEKLITRGIIIIRVDKDKFDRVLSDIKGLGLLLDESIKSDDVTDKFFDVESRLRLLRFEESRLEQYLQKINDPDTIFKTESRLTDIRHEIESLTGTLKKWSDLVDLSTITINMSERGFDSGVPQAENKSYWGRLSGGFLGSIKGVVKFCGEFIILIAQALPVLVLLGLLVVAGVFGYRRFFRWNNPVKKDNDIGSN